MVPIYAATIAREDVPRCRGGASCQTRNLDDAPLALLGKPTWSRTRTLTMYLMYGYLAIAVVLLAVKAAQLAGGH